MKAMILAAGKGTRMLPLTSSKPKALIEIQGISLLEHTINYLKYHHVTDIIINVHHHASQIIDFVIRNKSFGIHIEFSDETDALLDTGGGVYKARWFFDDQQPFILTSSDVITDLDLNEMISYHNANKPLVTLAVKHRSSSRDFIFDRNYFLTGWHNHRSGETRMVKNTDEYTRAAFSTIHIIDPDFFGSISERGSFSIIDVYLRLAEYLPILGFEHDHTDWFECGRYENLPALNASSDIHRIMNKYKSSQRKL